MASRHRTSAAQRMGWIMVLISVAVVAAPARAATEEAGCLTPVAPRRRRLLFSKLAAGRTDQDAVPKSRVGQPQGDARCPKKPLLE